MATSSKPQAPTSGSESKAPAFIAWTVTDKPSGTYWQKLGACWTHRDGKGLTVQLDAMPIDGRVVLRKPLDPPADQPAERSPSTKTRRAR